MPLSIASSLQAKEYPSRIDCLPQDNRRYKAHMIEPREIAKYYEGNEHALAFSWYILPNSLMKSYIKRDRIEQAQLRLQRSAAEKQEEIVNLIKVSSRMHRPILQATSMR